MVSRIADDGFAFFHQPRGFLVRGSFARLISIVKMVDCVVSGWTIYDTSTVFFHDFPCFFALQETDLWTISEMDVPGHIVYGRDLGKTAILCHRQVSQLRRSWVSHDRVTAILVGSSMFLSVYMPHAGYEENEYIETLDYVRGVMSEGKNWGPLISSSVEILTLSSQVGT